VAVGGYNPKALGEDLDLTIRLHRHCREKEIPYRVTFIPDPVAWTECPETLKSLGRQRDRWQRGLIESMWWHKGMLLNPRYGRLGLLAFPYFFFLETLGPIVECLGYLAFVTTILMGKASSPYVLAFVGVSFFLGIALSIAALSLEEMTFERYPRARDLLQLFLLAALENLGYRQLNAVWRVRGFVSKLRGVSTWGTLERRGFIKPDVNGS
jgi:cellulose synthase/poly-beta-1,6-N-acetylglucosamine synthase-like glycosyltransferase